MTTRFYTIATGIIWAANAVLVLLWIVGMARPSVAPTTVWQYVDDVGTPQPVVVVNREGQRIVSIDVYPPPGVPVYIHEESKP